MNVEQRKKWYNAPALKERMRTIQRKYNIGLWYLPRIATLQINF